jgi:hypothetical protein
LVSSGSSFWWWGVSMYDKNIEIIGCKIPCCLHLLVGLLSLLRHHHSPFPVWTPSRILMDHLSHTSLIIFVTYWNTHKRCVHGGILLYVKVPTSRYRCYTVRHYCAERIKYTPEYCT